MGTMSLFEFLGQPVSGPVHSVATEITEADQDEYDAPQASTVPSSVADALIWAETWETRSDGDTYDDNEGGIVLGVPQFWNMTNRTAFSSDTYDEDSGTATLSDAST